MWYSNGHALEAWYASILPVTGLNTTVSMPFMPLHLKVTYSQPTTNYTYITATARAGVISNFELSNYVLKMLIVIVVHQVIAISYLETDNAP